MCWVFSLGEICRSRLNVFASAKTALLPSEIVKTSMVLLDINLDIKQRFDLGISRTFYEF